MRMLRLWSVFGCFLSMISLTAEATHFRFGHYFWKQAGGNTIEVTLQNSWRLNAYTTNNGRCINPTTLTATNCTGANGNAGVGDVVVERQGATRFDWGDGSAAIGSPLGPLMYLVTSVDPANNWLFGLALDPASLPVVDTTLSHTYAAPGDYVAFTSSCCRISAVSGVNTHINNPDGRYRVETVINVGTQNNSPITAMFPIVNCPKNKLCSFFIPATDPDGDSLSFRLSTSAESAGFGGFTQPGAPFAPNQASIDPVSGLYTWDTTGATLAANLSQNTLYSTAVMIEDGTSKVAVDFLIQLVEDDPTPPVITPPVGSPPICSTTQVVSVGQTKTFDVNASDPDVQDDVTLNVIALPVGARMTPSLPVQGNPTSSVFSWTPDANQVGSHLVSFGASSSSGGFTTCSVTIEVRETISVDIDIKPGSFPNSINSQNKGSIPVAIISSVDFDAVNFIEAELLNFGATGDEVSLDFCNDNGEDVNDDGLLDLVCHFTTTLSDFEIGDIEGILKGFTLNGVPLEGSDSVRIVK